MADIELTQSEADNLLKMEKWAESQGTYDFPADGNSISISLISPDRKEEFLLDIRSGKLELSIATYQNRARSVIILARLDIGGSPHRNPDNTEIPCPHIHIYKEGYGAKWAYELPKDIFESDHDLERMLESFMSFCHVTKRPAIQWRLKG